MLDEPRNLIKNSPVTALTTAESLVAAVLTFLATHGILGDVDVSTTTQTIAPFVALAIPAVFGAAKWSLVTPFAKVKDLAERDGLVSDADFARLGALLDDKLGEWGYGVDSAGMDDVDEPDGDEEDGALEELDDDDVLAVETEGEGVEGGSPGGAPASFMDTVLAEHRPEHSAPEDPDESDDGAADGLDPVSPMREPPPGLSAGAPPD